MKKRKASKIDDLLDNLWAELVKINALYACEYCGKISSLNSHHVFSRTNRSVRWELTNGVCLCAGCHVLSSRFSAHQTPTEFTEWVKEYRGEEWYSNLRILAHSEKKWTQQEKEEHLNNLKCQKMLLADV